MVNRWRFPSASPMGSTVGRWMINMAMPPSGWTELLRVELDDERLAYGNVDVLASRFVEDRDAERVVTRFEPRRREPVERVEVVAQHDHPPRLVAHLRDVTLAHLVARDRHSPAVDVDVAVADELAGLGPTRSPSGAEHHVVESHL